MRPPDAFQEIVRWLQTANEGSAGFLGAQATTCDNITFESTQKAWYVHCRRGSASGRVRVLLRFEQAELCAEFVTAQVLALADGCHDGSKTFHSSYQYIHHLTACILRRMFRYRHEWFRGPTDLAMVPENMSNMPRYCTVSQTRPSALPCPHPYLAQAG